MGTAKPAEIALHGGLVVQPDPHAQARLRRVVLLRFDQGLHDAADTLEYLLMLGLVDPDEADVVRRNSIGVPIRGAAGGRQRRAAKDTPPP